jgi:hypothetical protein
MFYFNFNKNIQLNYFFFELDTIGNNNKDSNELD